MATRPPTERHDVMDADRGAVPLSVEIVEAVADTLDVEGVALDPLAESFDPDALEQLVESAAVPTRITMDVYGCTLEIDEEGDVTLRRGDSVE